MDKKWNGVFSSSVTMVIFEVSDLHYVIVRVDFVEVLTAPTVSVDLYVNAFAHLRRLGRIHLHLRSLHEDQTIRLFLGFYHLHHRRMH